ncbi:kinase-like protein [Sodiomyces alkalinus F11]|uniref:Kinase-like protein n=1 Tax=Sodiomyces alkalinus (strain CBS 110278 / VKM F-3762 / F11) TaxID=1314773 RepID=A0A3N2QAL0_SODAK|nr:kinase-like protein [Sodiomyces alkalinus F11]ROT43766.1 kinase-like protein [Sodiomyces alkalinus F11]
MSTPSAPQSVVNGAPSGKTSNVTPRVRFHAIDDAEGIWRYSAGGYLPVAVGDRLGDRYQVVHKLGHGSYSTVCTADASPRESEILSLLGKSPLDGTASHVVAGGKEMIPSVLDEFRVTGPHGTHTCLVTPPARSSVAQTRLSSFNRPFRLDVARAIAAQLILAVSYIHSKGIVHGDLHLGNVLLKMPLDFARLSDEELYEEWGGPELEPVTTFNGAPIPPGVPSHAVLPINLITRCDELPLADAHIVVTDFGEAFFPARESKTECSTPTHCRPPECRFEPLEPRSFPSDIWTLACSVWGIIGQRSLFEMIMSSEDDTTVLQVDALGKPPDNWWERWDARLDNFTEDGQPKNDRPDPISTLESEFRARYRGGVESLEWRS